MRRGMMEVRGDVIELRDIGFSAGLKYFGGALKE